MKRILTLIIIIVSTSCTSMLDEEVFDKVTPENFFQKESDAVIGVNGVYDGLQNHGYWYRQWLLAEALPGSLAHTWNERFNTMVYTDDTSQLWVLWTQSYNIIGRANSVLSVLESSPLEEAVKNALMGEVRYIRGMVYFNMVRMFGHIPLVKGVPASIADAKLPTEGSDASVFESDFLKQVDREVVYDFIIEDLEFAEANLPEATFSGGVDSGRARKGAATALLAKVYMTQAGMQYNYTTGALESGDASKWAMAASKVGELIGGVYDLEPNYGDVFENTNENNEEILFSIQYLESSVAGVTGEGSQVVARTGIRGANITPYAWKQSFTNSIFYNSWVNANGTTDSRYDVTFLTSYVNNAGNTVNYGSGNFIQPHVWKFVSDDNNPDIAALGATDYGDNTVYLRYADVLLMHSEALNESGGAPNATTISGINKVRERAGQPLITLPITQEDLREAIWQERKWELGFEGHYFFDCQRTGRLIDEITQNWYTKADNGGGNPRNIPLSAVTEKFYILPIHFNAMSANSSLVQNAGWVTGG